MGLKGLSALLTPCSSIVVLKSDQDGIERLYTDMHFLMRLIAVEIRPRWDWKKTATGLVFTVVLAGWNQTKMGLKVRESHENFSSLVCVVEIRPRWDWKICEADDCVSIFCFHSSWNQTKMGLKGVRRVLCILFWLHSLKSDQDGIERFLIFCFRLSKELKSDQDGIERHKLRPDIRTARKVEIRPRWDWKTFTSHNASILTSVRWNQTKMGLKDWRSS